MKDWKIGTRLGGGFALVLALVAAIAGIGVLRLQGVGDATHDMAQRSLVKERLAAGWLLHQHQQRAHLRAAEDQRPRSAGVPAEEHDQDQRSISETQKKLEELLSSPEELALSADIKKKRSRVRRLAQRHPQAQGRRQAGRSDAAHQRQAAVRRSRPTTPASAACWPPAGADRQVGRRHRRALPLGPQQRDRAGRCSRWRWVRCWHGC